MPPHIRRHRSLFGHNGIGEKTRSVDVEREEQQTADKTVGLRIGADEAERDGTVEGEVEHDVEETTEIGFARGACHRTIKSIAKPANDDNNGGGKVVLSGNEDSGNEAEREAGDRDRIGTDTPAGKCCTEPIQYRIQMFSHRAIKHRPRLSADLPPTHAILPLFLTKPSCCRIP